jgi:hypothetical protein
MHADLNGILAIVGVVVLWLGALELRLRKAQTKIAVADRKDKDEKIAKDAGALSDAELDALLDKNLGPKH